MLKDGTCLEQGTHEELMARPGETAIILHDCRVYPVVTKKGSCNQSLWGLLDRWPSNRSGLGLVKLNLQSPRWPGSRTTTTWPICSRLGEMGRLSHLGNSRKFAVIQFLVSRQRIRLSLKELGMGQN